MLQDRRIAGAAAAELAAHVVLHVATVGRPLVELGFELDFLVAAPQLEGDLVADLEFLNLRGEGFGVGDALAGHSQHQVVALDAGFFSGGLGHHLGDLDAPLADVHLHAEVARVRGRP